MTFIQCCAYIHCYKAHVLLHVCQNVLEGGSVLRAQLPASLNDASQSVSWHQRQGLKMTATHTPHYALSRNTLEWLLQENEFVEKGSVMEGERGGERGGRERRGETGGERERGGEGLDGI